MVVLLVVVVVLVMVVVVVLVMVVIVVLVVVLVVDENKPGMLCEDNVSMMTDPFFFLFWTDGTNTSTLKIEHGHQAS
jgi:hypothetical protein